MVCRNSIRRNNVSKGAEIRSVSGFRLLFCLITDKFNL